MKLHDLHPAPGSRKAKRRVGRGIAAGQGKTAGRGTKGQKSRAGGSIPAWFEGGQTPLHQRIPKLRGFKNKFKIHYEIVNLGDIARLVELGELESGDMPGAKPSKKGTAAPITVNQEILRAAGLVRRLDRPMKVLGGGSDELTTALFVVADAFSASARSKIEAAGGTVSVLEIPDEKRPALKADGEASEQTPKAAREAGEKAARLQAKADSDEAQAVPAKAAKAKPADVTAELEAPAASGAEADDDHAHGHDHDDHDHEAEATAEPGAVEADQADSETTDAAPAKPARAGRSAKARASAAESEVEADEDEPSEPSKPRTARKARASKPEPDA